MKITHHEKGALLVAIGTAMMKDSTCFEAARDGLRNDFIIIRMMAEGIDGKRAEELLETPVEVLIEAAI
jgi:hypothetical protein